MLAQAELRELWRDLAGTPVLSVYLDTRVTDPAMRDAWRPALLTAIRAAGAHLTDPEERARFERAAAWLREPEPLPGGVWGARGWAGFATEEGLRHAALLPVHPGTVAVWRDGPVIAPYVRALKQHRPVIIAMVESRSIRLYRYALDGLTELERLHVPDEQGGEGHVADSRSPRGTAAPAPRGAVATEEMARRRLAAFHRLALTLTQRLETLAGDAAAAEPAWVLLGGSPEWVHHAHELLRRPLDGRVLLSPTLRPDATDADIAREAGDAATTLRGARGRELVDQLLDRANGRARAEAGLPGVQRALHASAVDLLLVSPELIRTQLPVAEAAMRAALEQGSAIEVPSGDAAVALDGTAGGIAARLRFPIDGPEVVEGSEAAAPRGVEPGPRSVYPAPAR